MPKILVCDPIDKQCFASLQNLGYDMVEKTGMNEDELIATVPEFDAMMVRSATKATAKVIAAAKNMKVILRGGVGIDNIDSAAAKEHGIHVRNTPAASSMAVAELTIVNMFALARKIPLSNNSMQAAKWEKKKFKGTELCCKTLGLIGSGRIGSQVARIAAVLGMKVIAYDPYITEFEFGTLVKTADEVFENSDFISLHLPFNAETKNIVNAEAIEKMKATASVLNCARGGVVDEVAFANAVKEGKVAGGAFDVFVSEPPKDSPLAGIDGILLSPHIGASTKEAQARIGDELIAIVKEEIPI